MKLDKGMVSYLVSFLFLWLAGFIFWLGMTDGTDLYYVKSLRSPWLDQVMQWATRLSEEWIYFVLVVGLVFKEKFKALLIGLSGLLSMAVSAALKSYFALPRPKIWLSVRHQLRDFDNIVGHYIHDGFNSFPSGHTLSAFLLATTIAQLYPKWRFLVLALGVLVGFSRVYLVQHFLEDILFGSMLGIVLSLVLVFTAERIRLNRTGK